MPELDVLRGTAILVVVVYHGLFWSSVTTSNRIGRLVVQASSAGWLGVNLFFVLSGFLITGILLSTKGRPSYYRQFYLRRVFRILPAYFLTIAILLVIHQLTLGSTLVALLFLTNYSIFPVVGGYGPFWSLSVEEQFYLLWPMLVAKVSVRSLTILSFVLCVVCPFLRWLSVSRHLPLGEAHTSTYLIADNLAIGALAVIFARSRYGTLRNGKLLGLALIVGGGVFLTAGVPFGIMHRTNAFGGALQTVPWNLFFTGCLLLFLGLRSRLFSGPFTAPLRFLGYISYGLYIYHLLVFQAYDTVVRHLSHASLRAALSAGFTRLLLVGTLAVLVSWISRRFYEEYFLRLKTGSSVKQMREVQNV
jgi:peptidoglycan/LPS O-acetylase OafA/YrhL